MVAELDLGRVVRRLRASGAVLTETEAAAITALPYKILQVQTDDTVFEPGSRSLPGYVLLDGCLSRFKRQRLGARVNVSFELPGDIVNVENLLLDEVDCGARANCAATLAIVDLEALRGLWSQHRGIEAAFWRHALVKAASLEEWLLNIAKRSPTARIAHLLSELRTRLTVMDLSPEIVNMLHASPAEIGNAMSLQEVYVNRALGELCSLNLIKREDGMTVVLNADGLAAVGDFHTKYLHLLG